MQGWKRNVDDLDPLVQTRWGTRTVRYFDWPLDWSEALPAVAQRLEAESREGDLWAVEAGVSPIDNETGVRLLSLDCKESSLLVAIRMPVGSTSLDDVHLDGGIARVVSHLAISFNSEVVAVIGCDELATTEQAVLTFTVRSEPHRRRSHALVVRGQKT